MSLRKACLSCVALVLAAHSVPGQRPDARLSTSIGSASDVTGLTLHAATVGALVSARPSPKVALALGGSGTRFDGGGWSATTGASMHERSSMSGPALTLDLGADYTMTSYRTSYLTAAVTPALEATAGVVTGFVGGRASYAATTLTSPALPTSGPLGGFPAGPPDDRRRSVSRNGATVLYGGLLRLSGREANVSTVRYAEERGNVAGSSQLDRIASAALSLQNSVLAGSVGIRDADGQRSNFGTASLSLALSKPLSLEIAGGRYPANRLTGAAAGRFASLGVSIRFMGRHAAMPAPAGVERPAPGLTRLTISAPGADHVEVAGDFNRWTTVPAQRTANGVWYVDLRIPPGEYRYAFRIDGKEWRVPAGSRAAADDFGGNSAWLTVNAEAPRPTR